MVAQRRGVSFPDLKFLIAGFNGAEAIIEQNDRQFDQIKAGGFYARIGYNYGKN